MHWNLKSPYNRACLENQLHSHGKFELNISSYFKDTVQKQSVTKMLKRMGEDNDAIGERKM